jgi:type IV secretion system protein VirD4
MNYHFKNFTVFLILFGCIALACFYFSAMLAIGTISGYQKFFDVFLQKNLLKQLASLWEYLEYYWKIWWKYRAKLELHSNNYFELKLKVATFLPFTIISIILFLFRAPIMDFRPFKPKEKIHGDAKWAEEKDKKKSGLRSKTGMLLGRDNKGFLIAGGYQHALLFAPTGSGKGVGFVIPNLLFWQDSVIVHDIKLENYELTSGYRAIKMKQRVFLWNPASPDGISHCYNPLDFVSRKMGQMVDDVQKIANLLLPEQEFWQNEARSLIVGIMLYLIADKSKIKSFGEVVRTLRSDDVVYNLAVILDTMGKDIHPVAYMNIAAFLQKADKERSGVISTANSSLELWSNPLIDATTARSDFDVRTFKKVPTTVYVGLTPDNIQRLQPLMRIFYQQTSAAMSQRIPTKEDKFGVMYMMDEFPTLGKMEQFQTGIAYFRGYKVRLFLIIQDTEQLKGTYEESGMNSFLSNSTYRITFAANNMETANLISQLVGNKTVNQESLNKPKFLDLNPASRSLHVSETQRALLLPQEVINLPKEQQILLIEASPPIKSKKIFYFKEKFFTKRLLKKVEIPIQEPYIPNHGRNNAQQNPEDAKPTEDAKALEQA